MTNDEYWFWLLNIDGIGRKSIKRLLTIFRSPQEIFEAERKRIENTKILKNKVLDELIKTRQNKIFLREYERLYSHKIQFITIENELYPKQLNNIYDPPYAIYVKGKLPENETNVAIVGARNCSEYGKIVAEEYSKVLSQNGVGIVSGMARGIDSYGHWGAIKGNGKTYAVLGSGINVCYPKENMKLYDAIIENGGVISEYSINAAPIAWRFPDRNRIISGLSKIILIIEAKRKSGSLITGDFALEQGKDVYVVPGRVLDELSEGCNYLLSNGAGCAYSANEILKQLGVNREFKDRIIKNSVNLLETNENIVYSCLDFIPKKLEDIISELNLRQSEVISALLELEINGYVKETMKNYYVKVNI